MYSVPVAVPHLVLRNHPEIGTGSFVKLALLLTPKHQLNQFHWHVVDSQSFPLQIPGFTDLAANGAYSPSQVYTPSDVKDIIAYAGAVRAGTCLMML